MQIQSILLYSHDGQRRDLNFNLNGVSIIAGDSATGKSSLIEIVDYCLGSSECRVPDGTIREKVAWYATKLVSAETGQLFVARRGPARDQQSTQQFVILNGDEVTIPAAGKLRATHNLEEAVRTISEFLGIGPNQTQMPDQTVKGYNISIRHAIKFCLQYQDEIASKRTLFHQQAESFRAKSIYDSLPYLLGLQEDDYLDRLAKLKLAKKELAQAQRRVDEYEALAAGGLDLGGALIAEAAQVGIIAAGLNLPTTPEQLLNVLETIGRWTPGAVAPANASDDALTALQQSLIRMERERQEIKAQIVAAEEVAGLVAETATEWREQTARLTSIELFPSAGSVEVVCPLCEQPTGERQSELPQFESVKRQLVETTSNLTNLNVHLPDISEYVGTLREALVATDSRIASARQAIRQLQLERDESGAILDLAIRQAIVVGRVSQYLTGMRDPLSEGSLLRQALANARQKADELEASVGTEHVQRQLRAVADQLQEPMTEWARELRLEFAPEPFRIDFENLTVEVSRSGYYLPLYRMGSGKNWLGCHLIAHFALHAYFLDKRRPVPHFLFLDQPTQVFYPPEEVDMASGDFTNVKIRHANESEDRDIVRRIFEWIFRRAQEFNEFGGFQIIVTDHAELRTPQFQAAQIDPPRWRDGINSLVPPSW